MKTKLLALVLLAGGAALAGPRVVVGIGVGGYYPAPAPVVACWARPPYAHSYWVAPRYFGHRYYGGYWRR
jgi:hypothetical protein